MNSGGGVHRTRIISGWAAREGWVIVTRDKDFLRIARLEPHAGILFIARGRADIGYLVRALTAVFEDETMESLAGRVEYLRERIP